MRPAGRSLRLALACAALVAGAFPATAADRTVLAIGAHAGDAEITTGAVRGGISTFPYLEYYEALARVRGAVAGKRFAVALEVDPFAKKRVLDTLP